MVLSDDGSHLPTHEFLSRNVKLSTFEPGKIEQVYRTWSDGGKPTIRLFGPASSYPSFSSLSVYGADHNLEILHSMRYTLLAMIVALIYHAVVRFGGGESRLPSCLTVCSRPLVADLYKSNTMSCQGGSTSCPGGQDSSWAKWACSVFALLVKRHAHYYHQEYGTISTTACVARRMVWYISFHFVFDPLGPRPSRTAPRHPG